MALPSLSTVDLKLLGVFLAVVKAGGFAPAQAALNVAASTISIQIGTLEKRLGVVLCRRGRGGFALTEDGRRVHEAAQALFAQIEDFQARIGGLGGGMTGRLNLAVMENLITHPSFSLSALIARFRDGAPGVRVSIDTASPARLEEMVLGGAAHLAIGYFPRRLAQFTYAPTCEVVMELCAGAGHPLFDVAEPTPDMVRAAEHAHRGYVSTEQTPDAHRGFVFTAEAQSVEALAILVLSGRYLAFLPTHFTRRPGYAGRIRPILPERYAYRSSIEIVRNRAAPMTAPAARFMELVAASQ
ncbi:LysR family transcriptional regulator [Tistrella mobilis]|uniref:LysR family transcriptional regulator n=1 Tax=Tistrella mobilis TaxID=171437 RepID=UPI0035570CD5